MTKKYIAASEKIKMLLVFAHPDDETIGSGGTIAKYIAEYQAEVTVVSATRGEAGKCGEPPIVAQKDLGKTRERELRKALHHLGVQNIIFLDYIDATLHKLTNKQQIEIIDKIAKIISNIQPTILIYFPEDGISLHKDHIAMHNYTKAAIEKIRQKYQIPKIYHNTFRQKLVTTHIDIKKHKQKKYHALLEHKTQYYSMKRVFPNMVENQDFSVIPDYEHYQLIEQYGIEHLKRSNHYHESCLLDNLRSV